MNIHIISKSVLQASKQTNNGWSVLSFKIVIEVMTKNYDKIFTNNTKLTCNQRGVRSHGIKAIKFKEIKVYHAIVYNIRILNIMIKL